MIFKHGVSSSVEFLVQHMPKLLQHVTVRKPMTEPSERDWPRAHDVCV